MKRLLPSGAVLAAALAFAGTAGRNHPVGIGPTTAQPALQGISLGEAVGCRCSLFVDAGTAAVGQRGFNATGYLVPYYYDNANGLVESQSSLHCAIAAKLDGGLIRNVICPDLVVAARFGRILCTGYGIKGQDAGSGADQLPDSGPGPQPVVRTECWGPNLSSVP